MWGVGVLDAVSMRQVGWRRGWVHWRIQRGGEGGEVKVRHLRAKIWFGAYI